MNMHFAIDDIDDLGTRLYESLTVTDFQDLEEDVKELGEEGWERWCKDHAPTALEIIRQDGKPLLGYSDTDRLRFTYLILRQLRTTAAVINSDFTPVAPAKDLATLVFAASNMVAALEMNSRSSPLTAAW